MEKTITIGGVDVRLSNNIGWVFAYRDQFGRDIIPALMPALESIVSLVPAITKAGDEGGVVSVLQSSEMEDATLRLAGLEVTDLINIVWALAKAADDDIPEPRRWVRQFDEFPIDVIAPAAFDLVLSGVISSKNRTRLREMAKVLRPENQ